MRTFLPSRFPRTAHALSALSIIASAAPAAAQDGPRIDRSAWARGEQLVVDWNRFAQQIITAADGYANPLAATRAFAMMHLAMHDAINAAAPRYATYVIRTRDPLADPAIAAVQAAHDVLAELYPSQKPTLETYLAPYFREAGMGLEVGKGAVLGRRAAADVIAARANDNSSTQESYREGSAPGEYRFVPGTDFVFAPHWRTVRPFALISPAQFRTEAPPALTSPEYTRAFDEVKRKGGKASTARTAEESHYAAFWYEFSDIGWNRIARTVSRAHPQDLWTSARTFALLNAALADGYIAGWDSKLHYDFWRPVSAIRLAADDGNPRTAADTTWETFLPTPPVQDHPSTHSVLGAAAAAVLAHAFGRDDIAFGFASTSADPANPVRTFRSFSDAARENAESRVMAGLHFRFATVAGLELGERIGRYTVANLLEPMP